MLFERKLSENELEQREAVLQGLLKNKRNLVKKYGKEAEKVMYGIATKKAKSKVESMNKEKIKELITKALTKEEAVTSVEDVIDPADYGLIGIGYLKGFGRPHNLNLDQLEELGRKIVKQLYKGDFEAAYAKHAADLKEDNDPSGEYLEGDPDEKVEESSDVVADRDWDWTGDIDNILDKINKAPKAIKQRIQKLVKEGHSLEQDDIDFLQSLVDRMQRGKSWKAEEFTPLKRILKYIIKSNVISEENAYRDLDTALDYRAELGDIEKRIGNLYREMESDPDVEAEGGPVADQYGDELNKLERRQYVLKRWLKWYDEDGGVDQIHPPSMLSENEAQEDAVYNLRNIVDQIEQLGDEARQIVRQNFPNEMSRMEAYGVFNMVYSNNRYDVTLGGEVDRIEGGDYDDMDDEDYPMEENERLPIRRKKLAKAPKADKLASKQKMKLPSGLVSYMDFAEMIKEKLTKKHKIGDYVEDFEKSDAKQFKGKSDKKKKQMAVAAYLSKQND